MRSFTKATVTATALAVATIAAPAALSRATAPPTITVSPGDHLRGGQTVQVSARGITPGATVRVNQCDAFSGDRDSDCPDLTSTRADGSGNVSLSVTLRDPVYRSEEFGDPLPVYCRADACRIFLVWRDASRSEQVVASTPLQFTGSPATVAATPATNLVDTQFVHVTGTAAGAGPRRVQVVEEACFSVVQGSGCYGGLKVRTVRAGHDGSFGLVYVVHRYLSDGTDCAAPDILDACEISATILKADGTPDDSFGVSSVGQPAAFVSFRTGPGPSG